MSYYDYQNENGYSTSYENTQPTPTIEVTPTPAPEKKGKSNKIVKAVSLLTAVALVGTASGFGGSALYSSMYPTSSEQVLLSDGDFEFTTSDQQSGDNITTTEGGSTGTLSVASIAQKAQPSVVEITTEVVAQGQFSQSYVGTGAGSGVIISEDGYIVTNNHVIEDASTITVKTIDGESYEAELIGTDAETDLAVIKVDGAGMAAATIGSSADLEIGDYVMAIGNPLGELGGTVSDGIVSALSREITIEGETMTLLQTNAAISPGNSGGGLFNENGDLIAVVNAKSSDIDVEGIGFAIPIDIAVGVIEDLIDVGYVQGRFTLGVSIIEITDETTAMMYRVNDLGVYVQGLTQGGNAHIAGIQVGDRIVEFNGVEINSFDDLSRELENSEANQSVEVVVERAGQLVIINVVLNEETNETYQAVNS